MRARVLLTLALTACKGSPPLAAEIADRAWRAHEIVVDAGERAATCAEAGAAMQRAFAEHRQAFLDGLALDRDRKQLDEATEYLAAHEARYKHLEARMGFLADRCGDDPAVAEVFRKMESP